jgi:MSHA biogenesis protein MshM
MRAAGCQGEHVFSKPAIKLIALASQGLTRRINILCDKSLLAAFADDKYSVQLKHACAAIKDSDFRRYSRVTGRWWLVVGGVAAGLAIGIASRWIPWPANLSTLSWAGSVETTSSGAPEISNVPAQAGAASGHSPGTSFPSASAKDSADQSPDINGERPSGVVAPVTAPESSSGKRGESPNSAPSYQTALTVRTTIPPWEGQSKLAAERVVATNLWLQQTPPARYAIQLVTVVDSDTDWIEKFLHKATELVDEQRLYLFSWKVNGRPVYRVAYGTFETIQQSMTEIANLPGPLRAYQPYPEPVSAMRQMGTRQ